MISLDFPAVLAEWPLLASAAARDGHVIARAYRDAKMMEIIEGSNEICQLILAQHAVTTVSDII